MPVTAAPRTAPPWPARRAAEEEAAVDHDGGEPQRPHGGGDARFVIGMLQCLHLRDVQLPDLVAELCDEKRFDKAVRGPLARVRAILRRFAFGHHGVG